MMKPKTCNLNFAIMQNVITLFLSLIVVLLSTVEPLNADIYFYTDKNGVRHFTNVPTSSDYRPYIREPRRRRPTAWRVFNNKKYDNIITMASQNHGVSFPLIKAIIRAESGFNHRAVSKKGALGLMQLMPENVRLLRIKDPFDPWENIMGGTQFFKKQLHHYNGKVKLALAAYNAGPNAVDHYKGIPPYAETRNYVKKVIRFYKAYKK